MKVFYGETDSIPGVSGYNADILDVLNGHFQNLIDDGIIQAACYQMSKKGKTFVRASMGKLSPGPSSGDFLPDSIFCNDVVSRILVITAVLQLLEKGNIFLHQAVSTIIGEFDTDIHRQISVFNLLTHTSGLKADPGFFSEPYPEELSYDGCYKDDWIKKILAGPLQYKTGTVWNHCSNGYAVLSEIVSRVGGVEFQEYAGTNILKPLGMNDTYFSCEKIGGRVCTVTEGKKKKAVGKKDPAESSAFTASGGVYSTVDDLWKLGQMMLDGGAYKGKRILGKIMAEAAIKPLLKDYPAHNMKGGLFDEGYKSAYGLGWDLKINGMLPDETYGCDGDNACIYIDPKEDFIFAAFFPCEKRSPASSVEPLAIVWSGII